MPWSEVSVVDQRRRFIQEGPARHEHPRWGPKKLLWLVAERLDDELPAPSTVAGWLKRNGLVAARRRRPQRPHPGQPHGQATAPNALWTIDFKGHF